MLCQGHALRVMGSFELLVGGKPVGLAPNGQRLVGYLAVHGPQRRYALAGRLWGWTSDAQARATLRTALWRVRTAAPGVLSVDRDEVSIGPLVRVDFVESTSLALSLLARAPGGGEACSPDLFTSDLLPGWSEDWLQLERERHHQLRIHALEALSDQLRHAGSYATAIDVAYRAIAAEPLRESAHAALIRAHLAEGNRVEAVRQLTQFRLLLAEELGLAPSKRLESLLLDAA